MALNIVNASLFLARLALIGTFASCNVLAVSAEATLSGTLLDPQGAAVPNAVIDLRWNDTSGEMCWTAPHCRKQRRPAQEVSACSHRQRWPILHGTLTW